ncbi:MAG: BrnT family toxin [Steroidobacteraceae bacterium]
MYIRLAGLRITWDDHKRAVNLRKHGIDLVDAAAMFGGARLTVPDVRHDYGEHRLISARKALTHERETYEKAIQDELEGRRPHARR